MVHQRYQQIPVNFYEACLLTVHLLLGIAYQLVSTDPLVDADQCKRDAKQMQELGANAIRVYHVDPAGDHQGCMNAFADLGIYLLVDLDDFPTQILPVILASPD